MRLKYFMAVFALIMSGYSAHAQQSIDRITVDLQNVPLSEAMSEIEEICGYTFFWVPYPTTTVASSMVASSFI